jgi:pimeloyl-ACP methyl ester carboxylesterase
MDRRQKALLKRITSIFVPLLVLLVISLLGTAFYFAYRMVHPDRREVINTPEGYQQILKKPNWDDKTWAGAGGAEMSGWLLYHNYSAPVIILSHGYGSNREELLSTGYRLWDAGYNILVYDLRAHGASRSDTSSLGPDELADLEATIAFARELKTETGQPVGDGRIGLYGVDLGGTISLAAAAKDPAVKAVAVDSVYPSQEIYEQYLSRTIIGANDTPGASFVEGGFFQSILDLPLALLGASGEPPPPIDRAVAQLGDRPLLFLVSTSSRLTPFARQAAAVAESAPNAQIVELARTRTDVSLIKDDAKAYDDAVVSFFTQAKDFAPPPRPTRGNSQG